MNTDITEVLGLDNKPKMKEPVQSAKNKQIGLIIAIIGIALIVISQTQKFITEHKWHDEYVTGTDYSEDTTTKNLLLYSGIIGLVVGAIVFASGFKTASNNLLTQQNQTTTTATTNDTIEQQLEKLNSLRQKELITEEEFSNKKAELLSKL